MATESESVTSEEDFVSKRNKSQLQTDLTVLMMENENLKQELAHYKGKITNFYLKSIKFV